MHDKHGNNSDAQINPAPFTPVTATRAGTTLSIRIGTILTGIALLICILVAWFVFTARSVYIETSPIVTQVDIQGGFHFELADHYLINQGEYEISISAEGYYPIQQSLIVNEQQNQKYTFELQPLPGHLTVRTVPEVSAEIRLDDELKGTTPTTIHHISPGSHAISVIANNYLPHHEKIEIEGRDLEQTLEAKLLPAWAEVTIASHPAVADVFVDDILVGKTPLTTNILQGEHRLRVKLSGYKAWQDTINVTANQPITVPNINLEIADAVILLETKPAKANVTVNGEYKGQTPLEVALTPDATAEIRFFKEGYKRTSRKLAAKSGDKQKLHINLQAETVLIVVSSEPSDADLYIDGILRGRAQQTVELPTRPHRIEIRKRGYVSYVTTITPRTNIDQQINIRLKTLRQAKLESIKPVIKTSAGQTLKLFYPTGFKMGASRREPGRRSNESLRNISLTRPFYLSLYETTNAEYADFDKTHASGTTEGYSLNGDKQPVVNITWEQAALYCNWLSKKESLPLFYKVNNNKVIGFDRNAIGYRLPTEAEWAWSARVDAGQQILKFPWGEQLPPKENSGNFADESAAQLLAYIIKGFKDGYTVSAPVGRYQANSKGLYDMGGNVSEWVNDIYDVYIVSENVIETDPIGLQTGEHNVIRGSSWAHGTITELRLSYRDYGKQGRNDIGFRIARFLEQ